MKASGLSSSSAIRARLFDSCPVSPQHGESHLVERHTPRPVRLRRLLSESARDEYDRSPYLYLTLVEIEVGPAEGT